MKEKDQKTMSVVDDFRKVLQDFLAPELRELKAPLDAVNQRLDSMDQRAKDRHTEILDAFRASDIRMDRRVDSILDFAALRGKVAVLDAERQARLKAS